MDQEILDRPVFAADKEGTVESRHTLHFQQCTCLSKHTLLVDPPPHRIRCRLHVIRLRRRLEQTITR